jgi:hypothetical protein
LSHFFAGIGYRKPGERSSPHGVFHEDYSIYEGHPPQGFSEAQGEGGFSEFSVTDPPRGRPAGGGGVQHTGRYTGLDLSTYMNNLILMVWITSPQNTSENKRREIPVWL